ncbi:nuclear transport factor 2 family protein [Pseudonocardia acaciae]|uniref:nuclear transport factor 2 family protein n=1 Tax=Pseudonocardia acaciae TaxID=551276 RepID=UPI00048F6162|nr:nuclear transport factor 2 family protein [Pseudonocardia acaciae]
MRANTRRAGSTDVELVGELYQAFAVRDLERIRAAIAPDFVMEQTDLLPWGGRRHGPEGFFEFLRIALGHVDPVVEIDELFDAGGGRVVQIGHATGTVRAHGNRFRIRLIHVWQVRDGMLVSHRAYLDAPAMLAALRGGRDRRGRR